MSRNISSRNCASTTPVHAQAVTPGQTKNVGLTPRKKCVSFDTPAASAMATPHFRAARACFCFCRRSALQERALAKTKAVNTSGSGQIPGPLAGFFPDFCAPPRGYWHVCCLLPLLLHTRKVSPGAYSGLTMPQGSGSFRANCIRPSGKEGKPRGFLKKRFLKGIFHPPPAAEPAEEKTAAVEAQRVPLLNFSPCPWG